MGLVIEPALNKKTRWYTGLVVYTTNEKRKKKNMANLLNFYRDLKGEPAQGIMDMSLTQKYPLGCRFKKYDGRVFYYAQIGAADLIAGNLIQSAALGGAKTTVQHDLTPSAAAAGAREVTVTIDTTEQPKNTFKNGWLAVTDGDAAAAMGDLYFIKSHPLSATTMAITLYEPLKRAITSSSRISLRSDLYKGVIQSPVTTPTGVIVGVAPCVVTTLYFGWLQTWGVANVLSHDTALAMGTHLVRDVSTAGSVCPQKGTAADGINLIEEIIGTCGLVSDTGDSGFVDLCIRP